MFLKNMLKLIINEINLAPKTYLYEYVNNKNQLYYKDLATIKAKGMPSNNKIYDKDYEIMKSKADAINAEGPTENLNYQFYLDDEEHKIKFDGLKKIHKKITYKQEQAGLSHFSIINNKQKRTFNKTQWNGFDLKDNIFYPKGYESK